MINARSLCFQILTSVVTFPGVGCGLFFSLSWLPTPTSETLNNLSFDSSIICDNCIWSHNYTVFWIGCSTPPHLTIAVWLDKYYYYFYYLIKIVIVPINKKDWFWASNSLVWRVRFPDFHSYISPSLLSNRSWIRPSRSDQLRVCQ